MSNLPSSHWRNKAILASVFSARLWLIGAVPAQADLAAQSPISSTPTRHYELRGLTETPSCHGDCDLGGTVTIQELIRMVSIALGRALPSACEAGDANRDRNISIAELVSAVRSALHGCSKATPNATNGGTATETVTVPPTETRTSSPTAGAVATPTSSVTSITPTATECPETDGETLDGLNLRAWRVAENQAELFGYSDLETLRLCEATSAGSLVIGALTDPSSTDDEDSVILLALEAPRAAFLARVNRDGSTDFFSSAGGISFDEDGEVVALADTSILEGNQTLSGRRTSGCSDFWPNLACRIGEGVVSSPDCVGVVSLCLSVFKPAWPAVVGCISRLSPLCADEIAMIATSGSESVCGNPSESCARGSVCSNMDYCSFGSCHPGTFAPQSLECSSEVSGYPICSITPSQILRRRCLDGVCTPSRETCPQGTACQGPPNDSFCGACGDGVPAPPEACDDGNTINRDSCLNNCELNQCGDGFTNPETEQCDRSDLEHTCESLGFLGGTISCNPDCTLDSSLCSVCGDGVRDPGEACDHGGESETCDADCTFAGCGDGIVNRTRGEECEAKGDPCCVNCQTEECARCGDASFCENGGICTPVPNFSGHVSGTFSPPVPAALELNLVQTGLTASGTGTFTLTSFGACSNELASCQDSTDCDGGSCNRVFPVTTSLAIGCRGEITFIGGDSGGLPSAELTGSIIGNCARGSYQALGLRGTWTACGS